MRSKLRVHLLLLSTALAAIQPMLAQDRPSPLLDPLYLLHQRPTQAEPWMETQDPVKMGLAGTKTYSFTTTDVPGSDGTLALGAYGSTTVGMFYFSKTAGSQAFTLTGNTYQILNIPGATSGSQAWAINSTGTIVGGYADAANKAHGFIDKNGAFTNVDFPGAFGTVVYDINAAGLMVGVYQDATTAHGFMDNAGVFTVVDPPGDTGAWAFGTNKHGDVVGQYLDASNNSHGFLLSGGIYTTLDFPLAAGTAPAGINDSGVISGTYTDTGNFEHGFIYSKGSWSEVDVAGAANTLVYHIQNSGDIEGVYSDDKNEIHGIKGH